MRFVPLGDSYTIGTAVSEPERWPNQLAARVAQLDLVANPAVNGSTSADLIERQLPPLGALRPELVSVLIGVNDAVQGISDAAFATNAALILDELEGRPGPDRVFGVATPDYTVTPRGADYGDPAIRSDAIVRFNAILREDCERRGMAFVADIFEISREAGSDAALVADDGLHPSGAQYRRWVDAIEPVVRSLMGG